MTFKYSFCVIVKEKKQKNLYIRIKDKNTIIVSCPLRTPKKFIDKVIKENESNILNNLSKFSGNFESDEFFYGTTLKLLNKDYKLEIYESSKNYMEINSETIRVFHKNNVDPKVVYEKELKKISKDMFGKILSTAITQFNEEDISSLTIRKTRTRWGSCNSHLRTINLSLYLIEKDIRFIEYVIYHEVAHLKEANHSKRFWNHLATVMPDYKERRSLK